MIPYFPKQFATKAILIYLASLAIVSVVFYRHMLAPIYIAIGIMWVLLFFLLSHRYSHKWSGLEEGKFVRKLFFTALGLRLVWVTFSYFFYLIKTGIPFEFGASDSFGYHSEAIWFSEEGWSVAFDYLRHRSIGDRGYPIYLALLYNIFGPNIYLVRVIKCLLSSWMCVMVYRMAKRTLGDEVARMAGVFCCLMPNLIMYCGMHLKETEMLFLAVASLNQTDSMLHKGKLKLWDVVIEALLVVSLFFFRNVLGAAVIFAIISALVFTTNRMVGNWNRVVLITWAVIGLGVLAGGSIANEARGLWETRGDNQSSKRTQQVMRGYKWAEYATGAVMAPMIFVLPFPTMVDVDEQYNQQLIHGGNYVRNFLGIFVLIALFDALFRTKNWRDLSLMGAFEVAYLGIISMSGFANAERFLLPGVPVLLVMAAYGVSLVSEQNYRWVKIWWRVVPVMVFAWAFFKLGTRGIL
jgi:4-amino-4-deoxy-L-arabinose transferase-like glycosyltransferase